MLSWIVRTYSTRSRHATALQTPMNTEVDGRRAAQAERRDRRQHEEALGRDAEEHRADGIRDAVDDDVDGVLDRRALRRRERQVQQLVGRLVDREPQPLVEPVGEQHASRTPGTSRISRLPEPERERQHENRDRHAERAAAPDRRPAAAAGS